MKRFEEIIQMMPLTVNLRAVYKKDETTFEEPVYGLALVKITILTKNKEGYYAFQKIQTVIKPILTIDGEFDTDTGTENLIGYNYG